MSWGYIGPFTSPLSFLPQPQSIDDQAKDMKVLVMRNGRLSIKLFIPFRLLLIKAKCLKVLVMRNGRLSIKLFIPFRLLLIKAKG